MKKTILTIAACLLATNLLLAQTARQFDVRLWPMGLPNTNGIDKQPENLATHNYQPEIRVFLPPKAKSNGRAIIACPGGGYSALSLEEEGYDWASFLNEKGVAYIVLKYRMPRGNRDVPLSDGKKALQVVQDSAANWGINPRNIGVMGFSAGGHLAATLATHTQGQLCPAFQILFYPVITMHKEKTHRGSVVSFLGKDQDNEKAIDEFSNEKHVEANSTPPALLILCNDDRCVPPETNALPYFEALCRNHIYAAMHIYPKGDHGWGYRPSFVYHDEVLENLSDWLKDLPFNE